MSAERIISSLPFVGGKKTASKVTTQHPLGPLTASEILESSSLIRQEWPASTDIQFKAITLKEPNKAELAPFLEAERSGKKAPRPDRRSFVLYYLRNTVGRFKSQAL